MPNRLSFESGKLYRLVMHNRSQQQRYLTALEFAAAVWTRKARSGAMEVKGAIREVEALPGQTAEWFLAPVQAGDFALRCRSKGHGEAGTRGAFVIT